MFFDVQTEDVRGDYYISGGKYLISICVMTMYVVVWKKDYLGNHIVMLPHIILLGGEENRNRTVKYEGGLQ